MLVVHLDLVILNLVVILIIGDPARDRVVEEWKLMLAEELDLVIHSPAV